ncbi:MULTISPECIES: PAS domain-containing protein [unclassified Rhizobacter]|uniref:sensor histidine kinase n=1 Tax=unclassified Rhizobacter TaxID=2640088 RepID=UPI0012F76131|nr:MULTISPECIES: PAS domain-containing protein [unclassified Rhizobacter]
MTAPSSRPDHLPVATGAEPVRRGGWQGLLQHLSALGRNGPMLSPQRQRRAVADAHLGPMLLVNAAGRIDHANAAAQACFNGPPGGLLQGRDIADLFSGTVRLGDRAAVWPPGDAPQHGFECESQDLQHRHLVVRATPRFGVFGSVSGWTVSVRDCTAEQLAQQQLDAALRLLNHDLRAPHSTILSVVELWRLRQGAMNEADLLSQVENNAITALSMADNFVRYVRAQQTELRCETIDLNEVAAEAVDDLWERSRERRVTVRRPQSGGAPVHVVGDAQLLQRALGHLLRHALGRSPGGASIQCHVVCSGTGAAFEVTDHGATPEAVEGGVDLAGSRAVKAGDGVPVLPAEGDYALGFAALVARRHGGMLRQRRATTQGLTMSLSLPRLQSGGADSGPTPTAPAVAAVPASSSVSSRYPTP